MLDRGEGTLYSAMRCMKFIALLIVLVLTQTGYVLAGIKKVAAPAAKIKTERHESPREKKNRELAHQIVQAGKNRLLGEVQPKSAKKLLEAALEIDPANREARALLGEANRMLEALKHPPEVERFWHPTIPQQPVEPWQPRTERPKD